jgi:hypothetical protein
MGLDVSLLIELRLAEVSFITWVAFSYKEC